MNIVINALSARLGGGQTYLHNLLAHLPDRPDLKILIFAPASLGLPKDHRVHRGTTAWPTTNPLLRTVWEKFALPRILANREAKVLFCPGGVVASRVPSGCKTVTMFRNMTPFDPSAVARLRPGLQKLRIMILKRVMLRSMGNADLTIFISEHARRTIEILTLVPNPVTIPHGIAEAFRTHGKKLPRPDWLPRGEYLLYVSRFDVYKHQLEVATAFAALAPELTARYTLLFVGEIDQGLAGRVSALAREHGLEGQIRLVGSVSHSDLPGAYHHAALNLFASSCENCPNILLEALGAGRPVLSSDVMPMPEFGTDAVEYFSPTDPHSITDALRRVLTDVPRQKHLAAAAAQRSDAFDLAASAARTWDQITRLASR